jgi:hypothetical protein
MCVNWWSTNHIRAWIYLNPRGSQTSHPWNNNIHNIPLTSLSNLYFFFLTLHFKPHSLFIIHYSQCVSSLPSPNSHFTPQIIIIIFIDHLYNLHIRQEMLSQYSQISVNITRWVSPRLESQKNKINYNRSVLKPKIPQKLFKI